MEKMKIRTLWGEGLKIGHFQTIELMLAEAGRGDKNGTRSGAGRGCDGLQCYSTLYRLYVR